MNFTLFLPMLLGLQWLYVWVGRRASQRVESSQDYFSQKSNISLFQLTMTFLATQVGGGLILGSCDAAYAQGWIVLLYPLGAAIGLVTLGLFIGKKLAAFEVETVAEIFRHVHKSRTLQKIVSVFSISSLTVTMIAQFIASQRFLAAMGLDSPYLFLALWILVIFYTSRGGFQAVVLTDMIQAFVFIAALGLVALQAPLPTLPHSSTLLDATFHANWSWFWMPLLFMWIEQDMAQRCFTGHTKKQLFVATSCSGLLMMLLACIPISIGIFASHNQLEFAPGVSVMFGTIEQIANPWIGSFVACAVIAAIISTTTSLINAISSNLIHDFFPQSNLASIQKTTLTFSLFGLLASFIFTSVVDVMMLGYEVSVSTLLIPVLAAIFWKHPSKIPPYLAIFGGLMGCMAQKNLSIPFLPPPFPALLVSACGYGIGVGFSTLFKKKHIPQNIRSS